MPASSAPSTFSSISDLPLAEAIPKKEAGGGTGAEKVAIWLGLEAPLPHSDSPRNWAATFAKNGFSPRIVRWTRGAWRRAQRRGLPMIVWNQQGQSIALLPTDPPQVLDSLTAVLPLALEISPPGHASDLEDTTSRRSSWLRASLSPLFRNLGHIAAASLLINGFALAMPLFTMNVYDRVVPNSALETLWVLAVGIFAVFAIEFLTRLLRGGLVDIAGKGVDSVLSDRIFDHTVSMELGARPASAGSFAGHARGYEAVREFVSSSTVIALVDFPFSMLMFGLVFWLGGPIGYIPLAFSALALGVVIISQPLLARWLRTAHGDTVNRQALMTETANGLESIKAVNAASSLRRKMRNLVDKAATTELRAKQVSLFGGSFTALCVHFCSVAVLIASVYRVSEGLMSMGAVIACSMVVGRGMAPLGQLANLLLRLQGVLAALKGIRGIMQLPSEKDRAHLRRRPRYPELRLTQVSFTYRGQPIAALRELDLRIAPGERIGLIGAVGSGKSTLLRILSRQLSPSSGLMLIDGVDAAQLDPDLLRLSLGYLPQDGTLFFGTVRENILLGNEHLAGQDDELLLQAAGAAGVLQWTNRHPLGLQLPVGEQGVLISGGQRQTVMLARTLLRNPDVLLADEPTAHLDLSGENSFRQAITGFLQSHPKKTLVLSTHKLALLQLVNRVILLDQGRVLMDGPTAEVVARLRSGGLEGNSANSGTP